MEMDRESELEVVSRLREGDTRAFDLVYDAFNARLFTFLARLTRSRERAEDLLGETWLRLVRHADRLRPDTNLAAWLFTVARNLHTSHCRSRMLEESYLVEGLGLWPVAPQTSPFEETAASELERRLESALASLAPKYREVLLIVVMEGFSPADAAAVCGISQVALRQRLSRARAMLAQRLNESDRPGPAVLREVNP